MTLNDWTLGIARQHRRQFVSSRFGHATGELDDTCFRASAHRPEADKPLRNLLQERPEGLRVWRMVLEGEKVRAVEIKLPEDAPVSALWTGEGEEAAVIQGEAARLFAYRADGETLPFLVREAFEPTRVPTAPVAKSRTTRARAGKAAPRRAPRAPKRGRGR